LYPGAAVGFSIDDSAGCSPILLMRSMAEQPPRSDDSVTTPMISKGLGRLNNG
jgi:hypothetical protein